MNIEDIKCYFYIRVSGMGQVEKGGPERQLRACVDFCRAQGILYQPLPFSEEGVSGTVDCMDRPAFARMMEVIEYDPSPLKTRAIVVERMDRLARDLMVQEFLLRECRERGILVFAADQGALVDMAADGGDPTRKLIRQVLGALSEWEKSAIVLKLRKARERKRELTGRCEGPKPFGEGSDAERATLRSMLELAGICNSYQEIADRLNMAGLKTRRGNDWRKDTVFRTLYKTKKMAEWKQARLKK